MINSIDNIDIESLLEAYYQIENTIQWTDFGHKGKQAGLQFKDNEDPWTSAVGRSKGNDVSYTILNPNFKNTVFETLIDRYKLKRTRLMWVNPFACYSMHIDNTPRIHVPLITNANCYFVFKSGLIKNLAKGLIWHVDTRYPHTFMNCSEFPRLHLVGIVDN